MTKIIKAVCAAVLIYFIYAAAACTAFSLTYRREGDCPAAGSETFYTHERIRCVDSNDEALLWRLRVIEGAKEEIVFSTYDLRSDESGSLVMAALLSAPDRGVRVDMLLDGLNYCAGLRGDARFLALAGHPNVEAKVYNPIGLLRPWRNNFRWHEKFLAADSTAYILGGRNTSDLFLSKHEGRTNVDRDIVVWTDGPEGSAAELKSHFYDGWELASPRGGGRISKKRLERAENELRDIYRGAADAAPAGFAPVDWEAETVPAEGVALLHSPVEIKRKDPTLWASLCRYMEQGSDVVIQTPYIICGAEMYQRLDEICGGVDVEIFTNAAESGANPWGCADFLMQRGNIVSAGASVYECLTPESLHMKTFIIDSGLCAVGSYNLDMRSTYLNNEIMLLIRSPELNGRLRQEIDIYRDYSKKTAPDGGVTLGCKYAGTAMSRGKRAFYRCVRAIAAPFRPLL